jgi:hypothetical protein
MPVNTSKANEQWTRYTWCRDNGHEEFVRKAQRCDDFLLGSQWDRSDKATLNEEGRPALTINKILAAVETLLGEQIQNRAEVLFRPAAGSPAETAEALTKVWTQISRNNQLPWVRSEVYCDGLTRSRGFFDVRLDFNDALMGEVRITQLNSKNVLIDPDADDYDPDTWNDVFITKWMTWQDIAVLYNESDAEHLRLKEGSGFAGEYDAIEHARDRFAGLTPFSWFSGEGDSLDIARALRVIERQHRKLDKQLHFVDIETGDTRPVPGGWDRDKIAAFLEKTGGKLSTMKRLVKRLRWTVTCDDVVLHDEWSPYQHMTVVPYFPLFRYGRTLGVVENLLDSQELLNKASSQELHVINTTANSGWAIEQDSLVNMTVPELEVVGARTGLVLEYRKGSTPPQKILPNQVPTGLDRITFKAEEHIKAISNVTDTMMGQDREDVAAKAIAYKRQSSSVTHTKFTDNLQRTDYILARNVLDLVQTYYTEPRILGITNDGLGNETETLEINKPDPATGRIVNDLTLGEYDIVITSTPQRDTLEDSQFEQARALREIGVRLPDSVLIENSRLLNRAEILKSLEEARNSPEAQQAAQLQQRAMLADIGLKEAQALKTRAESQGKTVDAQGKARDVAEGSEGTQVELLKLGLERERLALEKTKLEQEAGKALRDEEASRRKELALREEADRKAQQAEREAQQAMERTRFEEQARRARELREQASVSGIRDQGSVNKCGREAPGNFPLIPDT